MNREKAPWAGFVAIGVAVVMFSLLTPLPPAVSAKLIQTAIFPITPGPELCTTERMPSSSVQDLVATPAPQLETIDVDSATTVTLHEEDEIVSAIVEVFACLNTGDPLRAWPLYSEKYLTQVLPRDDVVAVATPLVLENGEFTTIIEIRDVRRLADGRLYAVVVLDPALVPVEKMYGFVLVEVDGKWLVDDVLDELRFSLP